ncbi:winged helix-turn-helix domain-containing protein [Massilia sp. METH4]|uniref:ATP-binding protein n=1 Tax=Massilia sp. METH4 TaxID=3123041 RepID=UPI0030CF7C80
MESHDTSVTGAIAFGRHTFDPQRCELRTAGGPAVSLGQRAGSLLHALIDAGGRVLSRGDLLRRAWPGQDIDDGNLRVQIAALRRVLAEDRALIGTVAGRGYVFAGSVEAGGADRPRVPPPVATLVGRAALVDAVVAGVAATRFVTLAGAPGIGKSALALAAAHRHGGAMAWAELDAAATEEGMLACVAEALGLEAGQGWTAGAALARRLPRPPLLLVLDNCEHLAEACSRLAEVLLEAWPQLCVLATSRQPLLAAGEAVVRVPTLDLPAPDETDAARLAGSAGVALFLARAAAAGASCAPAKADLPLVAAICRRLDGLPLAIELAAAQVPALGLRGVAAGLDDMAWLLQAGRRAVAPRHRTLRAALDRSFVLLPLAAQDALRRIAALPSWFTLDEAAALLRPAQSCYDTIDSLATLAAHSLLVVEHGRQARFRVLATTRAYALLLGSS